MMPENRGDRPTAPQSQPDQNPAPGPNQGSGPVYQPSLEQPRAAYHYNTRPPNQPSAFQPQPAYPLAPGAVAKKTRKAGWWWGGLALGLVVMALVAALVVIPLFNRSSRTEADPFAVARDVPAAMATVPVSGTVGAANPAAPDKGAAVQVTGKGEFSKIDAIHYARGTATLGVGADGKKVLRFENFTSAQGPDLKVYLGTRPDGSLVKDGGLNLGALPATDGSYNIILPDDLDLSKYRAVVIWCEAFSVTFSVASLS